MAYGWGIRLAASNVKKGVMSVSGEDQNFTVWGFIKGFGKLLIGLLLLLQGLIGLVVLLLFVGVIVSVSNGMAGGDDEVSATIVKDSALVLNPKGVLVEQAEIIDPFEQALLEAYGASEPTQVEVHDIVKAIRKAKTDDRIKAIVLDLGALRIPASSASKLHYIAKTIDDFKTSGKSVIAVGDGYSQGQYLIAAHADEIYMNDYGNVVLYGYGRYSMFLKSFLEKLKITSHVFRVGTFKSAVEPFIRDDMSPEAKEANLAYLNFIWDAYAENVEAARELPPGAIKRYGNELGAIMRENGGDFARAAVQFGLVDELKSRPEQLAFLQEKFGKKKDGKSFKNVSFRRYLAAIDKDPDGPDPNVAIVTAAGVIVDGDEPPGQVAAGDTVAKYLKQALEDDDVKAVVLRVDSPGGSAFASEIMRGGVLALKAAGKPVVVSMGSLAASGGYWIAAPADEIWAAPTTITGSIGIFGYFNTFENSAAELGIYVDGVGTTSLAPIIATGIGPLPEAGADVIQQSVERGYERFLGVVSEGRKLDTAYIDSIAQGRVWIGSTAQELKLVDNLGDIDDAIAAAAARANLEKYDTVRMIESVSPFEKLLGNLSVRAMKAAGFDMQSARAGQSGLRKLIAQAEKQVQFFDQFNDPNAVYARCLNCQ